jgi:hypothetical protein
VTPQLRILGISISVVLFYNGFSLNLRAIKRRLAGYRSPKWIISLKTWTCNHHINRDNTWITAGGFDGLKVLWLPPDFRPDSHMATPTEPSGSVVIGCVSGRVVIMGFRESSFSDEV